MAGTRPRDSQATKFDTAEHQIAAALADVAFRDERAARAFLNKVLRLKRWKTYEQAGLVAPQPTSVQFMQFNQVCTNTISNGSNRSIYLGPAQRTKVHVLHALAHHAAPADKPLHGVEFIKVFLDLTQRYVGPDAKREAKDILISNRVKTRTVGPDIRARQRRAYLEKQAPAARTNLLRILEELGEDDSS